MSTLISLSSQALTPDFYDYEPNPIASVVCEGDFVCVFWPDDVKLACYKFWLRENTVGQGGIDLATRECILDPADLSDDMSVKSAVVDSAGDLIVQWCHDQQRSVYHSGWLRHIAENQHGKEWGKFILSILFLTLCSELNRKQSNHYRIL